MEIRKNDITGVMPEVGDVIATTKYGKLRVGRVFKFTKNGRPVINVAEEENFSYISHKAVMLDFIIINRNINL